ncbi:YbhQ family protein [Klebsiella pneumoniae]|uniref:YbhQ family protein n=1 Tax=Klebsiella pneumoniae TaxID=573 RepID=UPI001D128492|nr:YbhQ family protein [Klebsiella pneumoniae]
MKWQQRVRVATGLSCWQIMLHLLVVAVLVMGWISGALVRVGLGLCVLYSVTLLAMLFLQRHHEARWRDVGDFLEELTTTWYFGAAMIALWLLSRVLHNNLLLALAGLVILAGPAVVSLLAKDKNYAIFLRNIAYAAEPVVAAMTSSGHKLPHTISRLASFR